MERKGRYRYVNGKEAEFGREIGEMSDAEWRALVELHDYRPEPDTPFIADVPGGIIFLPGVEAEEFEPMPWRTPTLDEINDVLDEMVDEYLAKERENRDTNPPPGTNPRRSAG